MLNISYKRINDQVDQLSYKSFRIIAGKSVSNLMIKMIVALLLIAIFSMFLPWTQNVRAKGYVTTLNPYDRPQTVQAMIGGRIEKWFVQEGQQVSIGDTIVLISEIKEDYLDPDLLDRTQSQIDAKSNAATAYLDKAGNLSAQYRALADALEVKLEQNEIKIKQTRLKLTSDSMDLVAAKVKQQIAINQLKRIEELYNNGLKSLTDLEAKRLSFQEVQAKVVALENKLGTHRNELINLRTNRGAIQNDYQDKISKSRSERNSALSAKYDAEATMNKLQSQYNAYQKRQDNYAIRSPINGIVTEAIKYGLGEMLKNGDPIISIIPVSYDLGVEMYVEARDVPLFAKGQKVRIQFDGWPSIVFSGWPNNSYGTFGGRVFAIDNFINEGGKYRILVAPDPDESPWPDQVRVGGGANTITLLNQVRVGYEIWRQMNGFPADYYDKEKVQEVKTKAPLKKVK